ncbi:hypothetical protein BD410DRAFT_275351 [Rickenella mellea]|uniref:Uncharacterized protein n=1 Tax=Rickenella mellea TaxID=50990 RepID=A0A4Y7Q3Z3_9AGAM|nr:hypothetical protein BD410DRAFT_275351 [Rickenella mellea]
MENCVPTVVPLSLLFPRTHARTYGPYGRSGSPIQRIHPESYPHSPSETHRDGTPNPQVHRNDERTPTLPITQIIV